MTFIDTHAHIYAKEFDADLDEVLERSQSAGVEKIIMPNINSNSIEHMLKIESKDPSKYIATMGLHPCYVKEDFEIELKVVERWFEKRYFKALGEIGIDLYWDKSFYEQQKKAFVFQCELAKDLGIPIIIHARDSLDEIFELLDPIANEKLRGVFHCFSGTLDQAKKVLGYNFYLGFGGVATFKNGGQDKVIPFIDIDKILFETDAPYLAPVPYRGKRNEPAYVPLIAQRVAELLNVPINVLSEKTTKSAIKLFDL